MSTGKLINVIVLVYNVEKYLANCLDSIVNQTYKNFCVILIDDGSTDRSGSICDEYVKNDQRFKVVHKQNAKTNFGRKTGVEYAIKNSAPDSFITFVDGDDTVGANYLKCLVDEINNEGVDIAVCKYQYMFDGGRFKATGFLPDHKVVVQDNQRICKSIIKADRQFGMSRQVWCCLFPLKFFLNIDWDFSNIAIADDTLLFAQLVCQTKSAVFIPDEQYNFLQRANSFTNTSKVSLYKAIIQADKKIVELFKEVKGYDFYQIYEIESIRNYLNLIGSQADLPAKYRTYDLTKYLQYIKSIKYNSKLFKMSSAKQKFGIILIKTGGFSLYSFARKFTTKLGITQSFDISNL